MRTPSARSGCAGKKAAAATPCCTKVGLKRGPWTAEEDELLTNYIKREGEGRWRMMPKKAGLLRCGKSCRLRWMNYLRPSIKRGHITADEEDLIIRLHRLLGNRWSLIAGRIPGRTDNEIKNYWNTHLSRKLINQGINPKTHKPFNPNPSIEDNKDSSSSYVPLSYDQNVIIKKHSDDHKYIDEDGAKKDLEHFEDHEGHEDGDHEMINCCHDESFSSFLDSLINDDMIN